MAVEIIGGTSGVEVDVNSTLLVAAEALTVRATVPATGVWNASIVVEWDEVSTSAF